MNSVSVGNQIDEEDLEEELEALQQEQLDEQMLKTGTVPVADQIQRLPAAGDGPRKLLPQSLFHRCMVFC
jgi:charged multivesicular body protein 4